MKYVIYRSRFQPFTKGHLEAIRTFFDYEAEKQADCRLVIGIVTNRMLEETELGKEIEKHEILKNYFLRFKKDYNPLSEWFILRSINEAISYLHEERRKKIILTFMPDFVCTLSALHPDRELIEGFKFNKYEKDCKKIWNFLPYDDKERAWYFPIFDREDIDDLGCASSLGEEVITKEFYQKHTFPLRTYQIGLYGYTSYLLSNRNSTDLYPLITDSLKALLRYSDLERNKEFTPPTFIIQEHLFLRDSRGFEIPDIHKVYTPNILKRQLNKLKQDIDHTWEAKFKDFLRDEQPKELRNDFNKILEKINELIDKLDYPLLNYFTDLKENELIDERGKKFIKTIQYFDSKKR